MHLDIYDEYPAAATQEEATQIPVSSGHVSFVVGRQAAERAWPAIAAWLAERSDAS